MRNEAHQYLSRAMELVSKAQTQATVLGAAEEAMMAVQVLLLWSKRVSTHEDGDSKLFFCPAVHQRLTPRLCVLNQAQVRHAECTECKVGHVNQERVPLSWVV